MSNEYHKIETLFERDEKTFQVIPEKLRFPVYGQIKTWLWTEKIDGTNIRCIWNNGKLTLGGRTENASIPAELLNWLNANVSAEKLGEVFKGRSVVIYGEGFGGSIQSGHGYSKEQKFVVFDIFVEPNFYLSRENVVNVCEKLGLTYVPDFGEMTLDTAVAFVREGFPSRLAVDASKKSEGLVGRTCEPLFNAKGERLIVKLKTKDFLPGKRK